MPRKGRFVKGGRDGVEGVKEISNGWIAGVKWDRAGEFEGRGADDQVFVLKL